VYWKYPSGHACFACHAAVKDYFVSEGYELLDEAGLARFLAASEGAPHSVVVVAIDTIPSELLAGPPESTPLRTYLAAGGRIVWLGLPIDAIERDASGKVVRFDPARTGRLLGVDHTLGRLDWMGARATEADAGGGFRVVHRRLREPPGDATRSLPGRVGLASAWVKLRGPPGSGFVRLWGRAADSGSPSKVAEHAD
jgi:hypothetical protein